MALRYWVGGTANWSAVNTANWSATSGGAGGASVPTVADDVFFDGNSGTGTVTLTAAATVGTINFTGYTGTFTFGANLNSGNTTLGAGTTYTTNATVTSYSFLPRNVNLTFTANGKILPVNLNTGNMGGGNTVTFAGNADFQGNFLTNTSTHNFKAATGTTIDLRIGGNIDIRAMLTNATDHVTIKGYGTSKTFIASGGVATNLRVSFVSGSTYTSGSSGNIGTGNHFFTVEAGGQFTAVSTHTFNNSGTLTLSGFNASNNSDFMAYVQGTLSLATDTVIKSFIRIDGTIVITSTGGSRLLLEGNWNHSTTSNCTIDILEFSGTTTSTVTTWSNTTNIQVKSLTINKTGGGSVVFNPTNPLYPFRLFIPSGSTYFWTHTSGTVTQSSTSVIFISGSSVTSQLNYSCAVPSFKFSYLEINTGTLNLSSTLNCALLRLSLLSNTTFTSPTTFGFTVDRLQAINTSSASRNIALKSAVTYSILNDLLMLGGGPFGSILLNASTAPTKAIFNLENTAQQQVEFTSPTNIDSSGNNGVGSPIKQTIYTFNGTITTTFNWGTGIAPVPSTAATVGYTFVN